MIEVTLDGYHYRYVDSEKGKIWIGVKGYKGGLRSYSNCVVPTSLWSPLRSEAIRTGYSEADFSPPKKSVDKKVRKKTSKKSSNSISIFGE